MAGTYDFEIERGSTFSEQWKIPGFSSISGVSSALTIYNDDSINSAVIYSLTSIQATDPILLTIDSGSLVNDMYISDENTLTLAKGKYFYKFVVTPSNGRSVRWLEGTVTID